MVNSTPFNLLGQPPGSKIMLLPQIGGMTFSITNNSGWYDVLAFVNTNGSPLDISGIDFHAELRSSADDASNKLDMATNNSPPQLINGGPNGLLFFSVDVSLIKKLSPGIYVMDILAIDMASKMVFNLCEETTVMVTILQGITR
jgi:hypothetical protein